MDEHDKLRVGDQFLVHFSEEKRYKLQRARGHKIKYEGVWLTVVHIYEGKNFIGEPKISYTAGTLEDITSIVGSANNAYRPENYFWYAGEDFHEVRRKPPEAEASTQKNSLPFI